jgi:hypothetical protein
MLKKIGGLARALLIVLAVVAGFVAIGGINVALILVVLGLIAGLVMPRERMLLITAIVIALPTIGAALTTIPMIGTKLAAVATNIQLGSAAALASAIAIFLYELMMDGVLGVTGSGTTTKVAHA